MWKNFSKEPSPEDELVIVRHPTGGVHLRKFRAMESASYLGDWYDDDGNYDDSDIEWELWHKIPEFSNQEE